MLIPLLAGDNLESLQYKNVPPHTGEIPTENVGFPLKTWNFHWKHGIKPSSNSIFHSPWMGTTKLFLAPFQSAHVIN